MKKALITGITGQDGSYLAELLLDKGYEVHGIKRRASSINTERIDHLYQDQHSKEHNNFYLHYADLTDSSSLVSVIQRTEPDEIYNLAAQSHVAVSFEEPEYTANSDALGVLRILEAIRSLGLIDKTRFYQASTSELYGLVQQIPQSESTPFYPRSPYAAAKLYAYWITVNYREAYGIFACNGILFNHESERRGETFVTRKITRALAQIALGNSESLFLGNLDAKRDWGHAKDYVLAMWMMLQVDTPQDFVIATGEQYSVREFVTRSASILGLILDWEGEGLNETAKVSGFCDSANFVQKNTQYKQLLGQEIVKIDPRYFRPAEVNTLLGDPAKANKQLGWKPNISFDSLVEKMMESDYLAAAS